MTEAIPAFEGWLMWMAVFGFIVAMETVAVLLLLILYLYRRL